MVDLLDGHRLENQRLLLLPPPGYVLNDHGEGRPRRVELDVLDVQHQIAHRSLHIGVAAALLAVAVLFHQADVLIGLSQDVLNVAQPPVQILGQGVAEGHDAAAVHHEERLVDTLGEPVVLRHHLSQGVGDGLKALLREMNPLTDLPLLVHPLLQDQHADDMGAVADGLYRLDRAPILLGHGLHLLGSHPQAESAGHRRLVLRLGQQSHNRVLVGRRHTFRLGLRHHDGVPVPSGAVDEDVRALQIGQRLQRL